MSTISAFPIIFLTFISTAPAHQFSRSFLEKEATVHFANAADLSLADSAPFSTKLEAALRGSHNADACPVRGPSAFVREDKTPNRKHLLRTPPMGWNSWNYFQCDEKTLTDKTIREVADAIADTGLMSAGYQYVNIDDCWMQTAKHPRGPDEPLRSDPERFPDMKALADYIHSKGLKFGIYQDSGSCTCQRQPGSEGHEAQDAALFASWGVDYLKLDGCYIDPRNFKDTYTRWSSALWDQYQSKGQFIVFSCSWPAYTGNDPEKFDWPYINEICDLWRNYGDISKSYQSIDGISQWFAKHQEVLTNAAGPDKGWNDADMLEIGNDISKQEAMTQMNIWAILASPLIMGHDVRTRNPDDIEVLTQPHVIAVNQDTLGIQGKKVNDIELDSHQGSLQLWVRQLSGGYYAAVVWNRASVAVPAGFFISWKSFYLPDGPWYAKEAWSKKDLGLLEHGVAFWKSLHPRHSLLLILKPPNDMMISSDNGLPHPILASFMTPPAAPISATDFAQQDDTMHSALPIAAATSETTV